VVAILFLHPLHAEQHHLHASTSGAAGALICVKSCGFSAGKAQRFG